MTSYGICTECKQPESCQDMRVVLYELEGGNSVRGFVCRYCANILTQPAEPEPPRAGKIRSRLLSLRGRKNAK